MGNSALRFARGDSREISLLVVASWADEGAELSKDLWATATENFLVPSRLHGGCPSDCGQAVDNACVVHGLST